MEDVNEGLFVSFAECCCCGGVEETPKGKMRSLALYDRQLVAKEGKKETA